MHELTEILYDEWHMKTGKDVMDLRITSWLEEKSNILLNTIVTDKISADKVKKQIDYVLGIKEKSLEEKLAESINWGGQHDLKYGVLMRIAGIARQHFKDHPEELK